MIREKFKLAGKPTLVTSQTGASAEFVQSFQFFAPDLKSAGGIWYYARVLWIGDRGTMPLNERQGQNDGND